MDGLHNDFYKRAKVLYEIRRYNDVVSLLGPHLSVLDDSYIFFDSLYRMDQYNELLHLSSMIHPGNIRYVDILQLRAGSFYYLGNVERGEAEIIKAVNLAPCDAWGHYGYAAIQFTLDKYKSAHRSIMLAISLEPDVSCFYDLRAKICWARGNKKQAAIDFEKAVNLNPENDDALFGLAQCKTTIQEKLQLLQSALHLDPSDKRYQDDYKEIVNAFPWWLRQDRYPIQISTPIQITLVLSCFLFALLNPALAHAIDNINDPVYIHHVVYTLVFALIINNIWRSELLLVLCVILFSREIFLFPNSNQLLIFVLQVFGSVIALPFVKPIIFSKLEFCRGFLRILRTLPTSSAILKSLCISPFRQIDKVFFPWMAAIAFMFGMQGDHDLLWLCVGTSMLLPCMLMMQLCVVIPMLIITINLNSLRRLFLQLSVLFFPWFSIYAFFYVQLIFFSLLLNTPFFADIDTPVAVSFGYIISASTIRFYNSVADTNPSVQI